MDPRWDGSDPLTLESIESCLRFAEVFKELFIPQPLLNSHTDSYISRSARATYYLKSLSCISGEDPQKIELYHRKPHGTKYSVVFGNPGHNHRPRYGQNAGSYLTLRLDAIYDLGGGYSAFRNDRTENIFKAMIPMSDIQSVWIKRFPQNDYTSYSSHGLYDQSLYEISIKFRDNTRQERFVQMPNSSTFSSYPPFEPPVEDFKDAFRHARAITFRVKAQASAWNSIRQLQRELGLRTENHNDANEFFLDVEHIQRDRFRRRENRYDLEPENEYFVYDPSQLYLGHESESNGNYMGRTYTLGRQNRGYPRHRTSSFRY
ncbi:hypothetical protein ABW19_dt0209465 [Dactylella cylindrospora]|nr:hypothetical protein ABW19_dt0209465 [Dactylella cylindrospora]